MANYFVSKLAENGIVGGGETVDFKRSDFVLKETHCLKMRSESDAPDNVKK